MVSERPKCQVDIGGGVKARCTQHIGGAVRFGPADCNIQIAQHPGEGMGILIRQQRHRALEQDGFDAGLIEKLHGIAQHRA